MFSIDHQNLSGFEGLFISEVVSDRSGNERTVNYVKISAYLADGVDKHQCFVRVNKVWKAFTFQTNFMHKPVI